jgi:cyclophilin family peptidyl-prolyl cis-trans isomerase
MKYNIFPFLFMVLAIASCTKTPTADFEMSFEGDTAPLTVTFKNLSENAEGYMWDFGDGTSSTDAQPTHVFNASGTLNIKLTAINASKSAEVVKAITIKAAPMRKVEIVTNKGTMKLDLYNQTPLHRDNFIKLANEKYFDGLLFHRVMKEFMIQGGDPDSRNASADKSLGNGGPGYTVPAELNRGYHFRGALCAARQNDQVNPQKASSGSQFYIVHGMPINDDILNQMSSRNGVNYDATSRDYYKKVGGRPDLDGQYTVFGYLTEGYEVLDAIAVTPVSNKPLTTDRPLADVVIQSVRVLE